MVALLARHQRESAKLWNRTMAVKRERAQNTWSCRDVRHSPTHAGSRERARTFPGSRRCGGFSPAGADGASVAFVDVEYETASESATRWRSARGANAPVTIPSGQRSRAPPGGRGGRWRSLPRRGPVQHDRLTRRSPGPEALPPPGAGTASRGGAARGARRLAQVPALEGALVHEGVTLASLQAYVPGEPIGWEPLIARLAAGDRAGGLCRPRSRRSRRPCTARSPSGWAHRGSDCSGFTATSMWASSSTPAGRSCGRRPRRRGRRPDGPRLRRS